MPPSEGLLSTPHPRDHLIQVYTDDTFLVGVVAQFVESGLAQHEAVVIIATPGHVPAITDRLVADGVDVPAILDHKRLVVLDAEGRLARFMVDGMPNRSAFFSAMTAVLDDVRAAGHATIRLFGEMVDLLWDENLRATVRLEELWNEVLAEQRVSLLCAYRLDPFDGRAQRGVLHQVSRYHSHATPVENYERFDHAVDRAFTDVFGARGGDGRVLRELLLSGYPSVPATPPAQAAILALSDFPQSLANQVLELARQHYGATARKSA